MSFPQLIDADTQSGFDATSVTSHILTYPGNIGAGHLLICGLAVNSGSGALTFPSGWSAAQASRVDGAQRSQERYKICDGTESGNFTVTSDSGTEMVWQIFRVIDWHGTTIPEFNSTGGSGNPNPPALDPTNWGTEDTLWIALGYHENGNTTFTVYPPTSYTNGLETRTSTSTGYGMASGHRDNRVSSEDPGNFTISATRNWGGHTVGIRPAMLAVTFQAMLIG